MGDIKDEGEVSDPGARARVSISCKETLALRKELGSGSDVTGTSMHMIRLQREFGFNSDCECAIQFQDYSEARVISMMMVEFQVTGPR
ncbi:Zinc Finger And Btb Domain-Containing Protein 25 [Manis pentadactyla]|nr:Zinc Finger And Btb Domain-Containing Protein 25 [Manis pentadactyla]